MSASSKSRIRKPSGRIKPKPRTTPRVDSSEPKSSSVRKSAEHRQAKAPVRAMAMDLGEGEVLIAGQLSELVPVAQYASVTIGPDQIAFKLGGVDMGILADVDWDDEDVALTDEQQVVYDKVRGALRATSAILEEHLAEDRETVERSVRKHNEREAADAAKPKRRSR